MFRYNGFVEVIIKEEDRSIDAACAVAIEEGDVICVWTPEGYMPKFPLQENQLWVEDYLNEDGALN